MHAVDCFDLPDFLRLTRDQRKAVWKGVKVKPIPHFDEPKRVEEPATRALRLQIEREDREKKAARLAEVRARYGTKR